MNFADVCLCIAVFGATELKELGLPDLEHAAAALERKMRSAQDWRSAAGGGGWRGGGGKGLVLVQG